jgi:hypothetical protein
VAEQNEMTIAQAMELVVKDEQRRLKKREALKKWRKENKTKYNEYIKQWRAKRAAEVAEAKALLAANKK